YTYRDLIFSKDTKQNTFWPTFRTKSDFLKNFLLDMFFKMVGLFFLLKK
ncbi:unnamed protein product, partial [Staurois parvus]